MVRYAIMKHVTQMLVSILFIVTVLTIYLAFDFTITNAVPKKYPIDKHEHIHTDNTLKETSSILLLLKLKEINETLKYNNDQEPNTRSLKQKQRLGKPAQFHKSKTGIKMNQFGKDPRYRLLTTKITQRKNIKSKIDKSHM